jgi:hypothetical protein
VTVLQRRSIYVNFSVNILLEDLPDGLFCLIVPCWVLLPVCFKPDKTELWVERRCNSVEVGVRLYKESIKVGVELSEPK